QEHQQWDHKALETGSVPVGIGHIAPRAVADKCHFTVICFFISVSRLLKQVKNTYFAAFISLCLRQRAQATAGIRLMDNLA
ncbi:MAG TPA: hypothetical protein PKY95_11730, partial [candidate division Zixibacteria bacterium]|nr:hypothetical protein [candidate division Zixibacteria bacterium]